MPLPNPDIWGTPETWLDQNVMYTNNSYPDLKAGKAKVAAFRTLFNGIQADKLTFGEPIDKTICPCGQDPQVSCFGKLYATYHVDVPEAGQYNPTQTTEFEAPINWFIGEGSAEGGWTMRSAMTSMIPNQSDWRWAPNGNINTDSNRNTGVIPFVFYQLKSLLLSIEVQLIDGYSDSYYGNIPVTSNDVWIPLADWKLPANNTKKAYQIRFTINSITSVDLERNAIQYQSYTGDLMGNFTCAQIALLDGIKLVRGSDTLYYDYASYQNTSKTRFFYLTQLIHMNSGTERRYVILSVDKFINAQLKTTKGQSNDYISNVWQEIPYSEANYETIMKMVACFGIPFTDTTKLTFKFDYTDDDLYLPIIGSDGVTHGEYTHGANNVNNELYKFDSIFDFEPDNGYKIHVGDNRVKKIYIGSKLVQMAYLGDCTLK